MGYSRRGCVAMRTVGGEFAPTDAPTRLIIGILWTANVQVILQSNRIVLAVRFDHGRHMPPFA
jgi:hypothetical protein